MKYKVVYVVLGMHRSGTSMIAQMLQAVGIPLGNKLIGPANDNQKGFWEDEDIVALNERVFGELGVQWDSLNGFFHDHECFRTSGMNALKKDAEALLQSKLSTVNTFGFKDPRVSRLLPFWQSVFDDLNLRVRYVFTFRHPADVLASLKKRNGFSDIKSAWLWFLYNLDALLFLRQQARWVELRYESVLSDPASGVQKLCAAFDIDMATVEPAHLSRFCDEFVDPQLRHHSGSEAPSNDFVAALFERLSQLDSEQITRDDFQCSIKSMSENFQQDSTLLDLVEYAGSYEQASNQKIEQLETEKSSQFDGYHQEENRLISTIDNLSLSIEQYQATISNQKLTIAELKEGAKSSVKSLSKSVSEKQHLYEQLGNSQSQINQLNTRLEESQSTMMVLGERQRETKELLLQTEQNCARFQVRISDLGEQLKALRQDNEQLQHEALQSKNIIDTQHAAMEATQAKFNAKQVQSEIEFELEKKRLWDIVEKYRIKSEEKGSLTAKVKKRIRLGAAKLLGVEDGGDKSLFFLLRHRVKLTLKSVIYLLPENSQARHHIMQFLIRIKSVIYGELDGKKLRKSHEYILQNRQSEPVILNDIGASDLPHIDVSVVSHNSARFIDDFVNSLLRQRYPLDKISLVVVDNDSSDNTLALWASHKEKLSAQLSGFTLINSDNVGFGEGHNKAFKQSACEYVLVSNLDLEFTPDTIFNAVTYAVNDEALVASWECRQQPFEHPKFYDPVSLDTSWSSHACVLIRRACFDQVGGYEKRIFMYGEDVELSFRFRANGFRIKYLPKSVVFHYTYEEAAQVKPLQFAGSTLANSYIRLRYGSKIDVLSIPKMYASLLSADIGIPDARRILFKNLRTLLLNTPYFLSTRQCKHAGFSFRHWDYEMIRDGAFYEAPSVDRCLQGGEPPLVSVITRTYKGREYWLREALMSIVNQTHEAVEVVIVEDGGDTMRPLIEKFQRQHKQISFVYKPLPKRGRCYAGNQGLSLATGDYMMFLDDDDLLFGDHIEVSLCELQNDPSLSAVYALSWDVETQLKGDALDEGYVEMSHSTSDVLRQSYDREVLQHHNYISIQSIVFKRDLYEQHGGFDEELDNLEDWNLWVRYSSNATFKLIAKTTSMFRTPWSVTEKAQRQKTLDAYYHQAVEKNKHYLLSARTKAHDQMHNNKPKVT